MQRFTSVQTLIALVNVILCLLGLYILLLILPFLLPVWAVMKAIFIPLLLAAVFAYLLYPLVQMFIHWNVPKTISVLIVFCMLFGLLVVFMWLGFPVLVEQVDSLLQSLPEIEAQFVSWFQAFDNHVERMPSGIHAAIDRAVNNIEARLTREIEQGMMALAGVYDRVMILAVIPFLVFYLLQDKQGIQSSIERILPKRWQQTLAGVEQDIGHSLGEYIRGQIIISILVGILAAFAYTLIDLPYSLFLALIIMVTNLIPYFGPIIGAIPALFVALITDPTLILWVLLVNVVIQVIEGNVLAPYIMGKRLKLHPILIILALLAGAKLGGLGGLVLAVPVLVIFKVIVATVFRQLEQRRTFTSDS